MLRAPQPAHHTPPERRATATADPVALLGRLGLLVKGENHQADDERHEDGDEYQLDQQERRHGDCPPGGDAMMVVWATASS